MTPFPIAQRLVTDRIERYRNAASRRDLATGRLNRPSDGARGVAPVRSTGDER